MSPLTIRLMNIDLADGTKEILATSLRDSAIATLPAFNYIIYPILKLSLS